MIAKDLIPSQSAISNWWRWVHHSNDLKMRGLAIGGHQQPEFYLLSDFYQFVSLIYSLSH